MKTFRTQSGLEHQYNDSLPESLYEKAALKLAEHAGESVSFNGQVICRVITCSVCKTTEYNAGKFCGNCGTKLG